MSGAIGRAVDRAFLVIGAAFLIGGPYLGIINYIYYMPEAVELQAEVTALPDDGKAAVDYIYEGERYTGEIYLPAEESALRTGDAIMVYILDDAPFDPRFEYPREPADELRDTLMITFGPFIMGLLLTGSRLLGRRGERRQHREMTQTMRNARRVFRRPVSGSPGVPLHTARFRGNWFIGGIMTGIGTIVSAIVITSIIGSGEWSAPGTLILLFPLFLGLGIISIGWPEFNSEHIAIMPDQITIIRRTPFGRRSTEIPLRTVYGLVERITTVTHRKDQYPRAVFREYAPLTDNPAHTGHTLIKIPDSEDAWREAREFSALIGIPLLYEEEETLKVVDPEGNEYRLPEPELEGAAVREFRGRYMRIEANSDTELVLHRGSKTGLIWGVAILALGITGTILSGEPVILLPTLVMALFFIGSAGKSDTLSVRGSAVQLEDRFFGRSLGGVTIPFDKIERLAVESDPRRHMATVIRINSADESINWGHGTKRGDLEWIEARIRELSGL